MGGQYRTYGIKLEHRNGFSKKNPSVITDIFITLAKNIKIDWHTRLLNHDLFWKGKRALSGCGENRGYSVLFERNNEGHDP